jgi:hypothetical protein
MSAEIRRLDEQAVTVRSMDLRPATIAAELAAIERERAELLARARGNRGAGGTRARRLIARLPEIVEAYRKLVQAGIKSLASIEAVEEVHQATRELLVDGHIVLAPSPDRTHVVGDVRWVELGEHVLTLAGFARHSQAISKRGSGSVIANGGLPAIPLRRKAS